MGLCVGSDCSFPLSTSPLPLSTFPLVGSHSLPSPPPSLPPPSLSPFSLPPSHPPSLQSFLSQSVWHIPQYYSSTYLMLSEKLSFTQALEQLREETRCEVSWNSDTVYHTSHCYLFRQNSGFVHEQLKLWEARIDTRCMHVLLNVHVETSGNANKGYKHHCCCYSYSADVPVHVHALTQIPCTIVCCDCTLILHCSVLLCAISTHVHVSFVYIVTCP